MKRIKIMLLSFALLAVVGGALAFKAKFEEKFCYQTSAAGAGAFCFTTVLLQVKTANNAPSPAVVSYYTSARDLGNGLQCYTWINGENGETTSLTCPTSKFLVQDF